jgi:hypothetical protein
MKPRIVAMLVVVAGLVGIVEASKGSSIYWTNQGGMPDLIAIGTITQVHTAAWKTVGIEEDDGIRLYYSANNGRIEMEDVLWGDPNAAPLWISWYAEAHLDPPQDYVVWTSALDEVELGARKIWILWRHAHGGPDWAANTPDSLWVWQRQEVGRLEQIKAEIEMHRRK